jgi:hypothetical protein
MHTKKDKEYKCRDCHETVWVKSVTVMLADLRLCPQCYTLRAQDGSRKDRAQLIVKAAGGMTTEEAVEAIAIGQAMKILAKDNLDGLPVQQAVLYLEHGPEMVETMKRECRLCEYNKGAGLYDCNQGGCGLEITLKKLEGK